MGKLTFKGGIHPYEGKELAKNQPVEKYLPKGDMVYLMSQHIGAPSVPCVKKGDQVLAGQKIADAGGFVSVPQHASVSGTVKGIEKRLNATGAMVDAVIVDNDQQYQEVEFTPARLEDLSKEEILNRIKEGGVVGMGGAGFPTHIKLSVRNPKRIRYVLINGTECEPYMTSDYRRMLESPECLVEGLRIVLSLFERATGIFAMEDNKRDAITAMQMASGSEPRMEVRVLETKYPQGAERMLIYACTGAEINTSQLPADAGCIVLNVETLHAIYEALVLGLPVTKRAVTVTGKALKEPKNFLVRIGTSFSELPEAAGGYAKQPKKFVCGGPMRGVEMKNLEVPVTKTATGFLCMSQDYTDKPGVCIRCGSCTEACPIYLLPTKLADAAEAGKEQEFRDMNGMECLGCGSCSFVCPARRQLAPSIQDMRRKLLAQGRR